METHRQTTEPHAPDEGVEPHYYVYTLWCGDDDDRYSALDMMGLDDTLPQQTFAYAYTPQSHLQTIAPWVSGCVWVCVCVWL